MTLRFSERSSLYILKNANFDLIEAGDGLEGLKQLEGNAVDLIVSDMNMPNMDGISFIKK